MSITRALSHAISGLQATSRGTEVVSSNLSNALTPGFGRRQLNVSSQVLGGYGGGVRVVGVERIVDEGVLAEHRVANAAQSDVEMRLAYSKRMETLVGIPGQSGSLGNTLGDFQTAVVDAIVRPDDDIRLSNVLDGAQRLASKLNTIGEGIQKARTEADADISNYVRELSSGLDRVAYLNRRITSVGTSGADTSSLDDERQNIIDQISQIVPIQAVAREGGRVALFTTGGAVLLDGRHPVPVTFQAAGQITPDMVAGTGPMHWITYGDKELTGGQLRMFAGGALEAAFEIRDKLAPEMQTEIDAVALDLYQRLADTAVDASLPPGSPGLFTDAGGAANATLAGLAQRLQVNSATDPANGGHLWRIRAGIGAASPGSVGDATTLRNISEAMSRVQAAPATSPFSGSDPLRGLVASFEARVATRRVTNENDAMVRSARTSTLRSALLDGGVDSDAEMQRLLQYEQAYAANARVIQAVDEMMSALLRI